MEAFQRSHREFRKSQSLDQTAVERGHIAAVKLAEEHSAGGALHEAEQTLVGGLGLATDAWTNSIATAVVIHAIDFQEIRNRVK